MKLHFKLVFFLYVKVRFPVFVHKWQTKLLKNKHTLKFYVGSSSFVWTYIQLFRRYILPLFVHYDLLLSVLTLVTIC